MATFSIDSTTHRSPNYDARPAHTSIWSIIWHTCEGKPPGDEQQSSIPWLCNPTSGVSCHYYITREGKIYQLVDDAKRAWHAGKSVLNGVWYCNDYSIGVETEHVDNGPPMPRTQLDAITWLARTLIARYAIPKSGVSTHRAVAYPFGRKSDPTDVSDAQFYDWVDDLYAVDELRARTLAGVPGTGDRYCSIPVYDFYNARGGLTYCGYPLADEYEAIYGSTNASCSVLPCERVTLKRSDEYGVEQALQREALEEGWVIL